MNGSTRKEIRPNTFMQCARLQFSFFFSPIISQYIMANLSKDGFKFDPKRIYLEKMSEYICECMLYAGKRIDH